MYFPLFSCASPDFGHLPVTPSLTDQSRLAQGKALPVGDWASQSKGGCFSPASFFRGRKAQIW